MNKIIFFGAVLLVGVGGIAALNWYLDSQMPEGDPEFIRESVSGVAAPSEGTTLAVNFQIGDAVPDIEGVDLNDVSFKLSDYRGKVVMVDFWGDW